MALMPPVSVTTGAAVSTNGTLTFGYPARPAPFGENTLAGDYAGSVGHAAYAEGLQSALMYQRDFTLTFNATNITFTYLGTSIIPANTKVQLQLDTIGQNESVGPFTKYPDSAYLSKSGAPGDASSQSPVSPAFAGLSTRVQDALPIYVNLGSPLAASATAVVNAQPRTGGAAQVTTYAAPVALDTPRTLQYVSSGVGDTTQTVLVTGVDEYGVTLHEQITLNGTTVVHGKKAFAKVISDQVSANLAGNLSIGSDVAVGLPAMLLGTSKAYVVAEIVNGAVVTTGTFVAASTAQPTNTTGDIRGTYQPASAFAGGTASYEIFMWAPVLSSALVPQA